MHQEPRKIYGFDNFRLDPVKRILMRDTQAVQLPAKAFDLLVVMVENNGRLLERDELVQLLWPGQFVEESNLSVNVSALRKALGKNKAQYILTIPRQGYRFIADVSTKDIAQTSTGTYPIPFLDPNAGGTEETSSVKWLSSRINDPVETTSRVEQDRAGIPWAHLGKAFGIGALLLIAIGFGYWRYKRPEAGTIPKPAIQMGIKRLTLHGKVLRAALSSDGKYFAYVREDKGERSLWLGQTSDGSSTQLRPPSEIVFGSLVFAPDDNSIYCVGTSKGQLNSVLYRMSVLGAKTEIVLEHISSQPAFSPDGSQIAFVRHLPEKRESVLLTANAADGKEERVLAVRGWDTRFTSDGGSWSPDGKLIAVAALSKDSSNSMGREVLGVQVADGAITPLTRQLWTAIHRLEWLHDGSGLVMVATGKPTVEWLQLWYLSYPDGETRRISQDLTTYNQSSLSLSFNDNSLLAVQLQQINNIWGAPAADLEQAKQITFGPPGRLDGAYGLEWTQDGRIFYTASTGDGISIWSMKTDGSEVKAITPSGYVERQISLTTDGRYMVFESNRGGSLEVWRTNLDGGQPQQLTTGGQNQSPHVSPDGQWVLYASTRTGLSTVWRTAIEDGTPLQLTDKESAWPRISPDGKQFACFYRADTGSLWQLAVFDIAGGPPRRLFALPDTANVRNGPRWTPDGLAVTYRDWKDGIWRQPLNTATVERIPGLPKEKLYSYAWSPDASQFAFARGTESYDAVLISNFR